LFFTGLGSWPSAQTPATLGDLVFSVRVYDSKVPIIVSLFALQDLAMSCTFSRSHEEGMHGTWQENVDSLDFASALPTATKAPLRPHTALWPPIVNTMLP